MRRWLARQLLGTLEQTEPVVVILDPDGVISKEDLDDLNCQVEVAPATDWKSLRRLWDLDIRRRKEPGKVAVLLQRTEFPDHLPLPWDIERSCRTVTVYWPVPPGLRSIFLESFELGDALADAWKETASETATVAKVFDVQYGTPSSELESIASLIARYDMPNTLWAFLANHFQTALAQSVAMAGGDLSPVQEAWKGWLAGAGTPGRYTEVANSPGAILRLLGEGRLLPEPCFALGLPEWTRIGAKGSSPSSVVDELLATPPTDPKTFEGWAQAATWWGQIRYLCSQAAVSAPTQAKVDATWEGLNESFQPWLRSHYGQELMSSSPRPKALHRISAFLDRRVQAGAKVLLIVLDGMAFSQWHQIQQTSKIHVVSTSACLAMIPTLTEVSRQAIFAGDLPFKFQETLGTTKGEEKHWRTWWKDKGLGDTQVAYLRVQGDQPISPPLGQVQVAAIVISAVDELLHTSNLLGDAQLTANLELWLKQEVLTNLIRESVAGGFEVWLTSDHGNLECDAAPVPNQGDLTERTGYRVMTYSSAVLRDNAQGFGVAWKPPGFPDTKVFPLFARGRKGFHRSGVKVIHGGMSLDEVMVPFAQVTA